MEYELQYSYQRDLPFTILRFINHEKQMYIHQNIDEANNQIRKNN